MIAVDVPEHLKGARELMLPYAPWPKQRIFHDSLAKYRLFGGSAGPGKSLSLMMEASLTANEWPWVSTLLLRRTFPELEGGMIRLFHEHIPRDLYQSFSEQKHIVTWHNGSITRFGSCDSKGAIYKYQGHEHVFVGWDELTQFHFAEWSAIYPWNRCAVQGSFSSMAGATNPIGIGLQWVKSLFYLRRPTAEMDDSQRRQYNPADYEFIGATYKDNPVYANDQEFIRNLRQLPKNLRAALKEGSWDTIAGSYFENFDQSRHVRSHAEILALLKPWHTRWISIDWGYAHNSAVYWNAQVENRTLTYREFVKNKMSAPKLAERIAELNQQETIESIYLSPDAYAKRSDEATIAEQLGSVLREKGLPYPARASDDRKGGAQLMFVMLENGSWLISESCESLIDVIPICVHDPDDPEDVLKWDGDDAYDASRYGIYSKLGPAKEPREERIAKKVTSIDPTIRAIQTRLAEAEADREEASAFGVKRSRFRGRLG